MRAARRLRLGGYVQGVGFRPFVYRLAHALELVGTVRNLNGEVDVVISGPRAALDRFMHEVIASAPPLARPRLIDAQAIAVPQTTTFTILDSAAEGAARIFVPADAFTCPDCLDELSDPTDRRHRYPFINCTQCGPRYTLIEALPYDRANTTMAGFTLCPRCAAEYRDPGNRRFHAEPLACAQCGPSVWLEAAELDAPLHGEFALRRVVQLLLAGAIVAVKGVGGYHLLCDATSDVAVARLRARKQRPDKPLAVMYPQCGSDGLAEVRRDVQLSEAECQWVLSAARPIVLARRRAGARLSRWIAPGLTEVGVFLPYSPLHHLLLGDAGRALVATSGNVSGEPVITDVVVARAQLAAVADAILHHDRHIARPADDSVVRVLEDRARVVRIGRGLGPLELPLARPLDRPVLATGGHLKATIALAWEDRVVISPHIGDMGIARSVRTFAQVAQDLQRLYGIRAAEVVCDAHPDYATSRWARASGLPVTCIPHHQAHASALAGQSDVNEPMLVFTWDGTGLGEDGSLWGGEAFLGTPGHWRRVASLRPFRLPGGERAARAPWRCAAGVCWESGLELPGPQPDAPVRQAWEHGVNSPWSSAAGRLFDAAAALVLGMRTTSYEGQAAMQLEAAGLEGAASPQCTMPPTVPPLYRDTMGVLRLDWRALLAALLDCREPSVQRAYAFHSALAHGIAAQARTLRGQGVRHVGLSGGVFQNALLTELTCSELRVAGFEVSLCERVPCNDGGLCYGQIIEYAARCTRPQQPC